jgi:hypothetical protein
LAEAAIRWLARAIAPHIPPRRPREVGVQLLREDGTMLIYKPILPASTAPDVTVRTLSVVMGADEPYSVEVDDTTELAVVEGAIVTLVLRDTDDAGTVSDPSPAFTFTAADTIAPPAPGELGVTLIREDT